MPLHAQSALSCHGTQTLSLQSDSPLRAVVRSGPRAESGAIGAALTPTTQAEIRVPQDLRNPGSPRSPSGSSRTPPWLRKSGWGSHADAWGVDGSPQAPPHPAAQVVSPAPAERAWPSLDSSRPPPHLSRCPHPGPTLPPGTPLTASPWTGSPLPCAPAPRRPGRLE